MSKNLVIVESPAKAKTIEKYLGKDFKVESSYGHIRDLPKSGMNIDIEGGTFNPTYEVSSDKKKRVTELRKLAKAAKTVWLASDRDREGEAIAWHLKEALKLKPESTKRITFDEITKSAITEAIKNPRNIDMPLVEAQQARRVLDRLVGYELSPVLWKKIKTGLSAGRVQSVAVRLVVEKEREIEGFETKPSWRSVADFITKKGEKLKAELNKKIDGEEDAKAFLESAQAANYQVEAVTKTPAKRSPAAPFTTSTLQQEASRKMSMGVKQTMMTAQRLYEQGLITYMRTDSFNLSDQALKQAEEVIKEEFGKEYHKARTYKSKSKGAQEAHEAIRPTDLSREIAGADEGQRRLYSLIRKRTLASQMADAKLERTTIKIPVEKTEYYFNAKGEVILFSGFLGVYLEGTDDENDDKVEGLLPKVSEGEALEYETITSTERFSRPPARYTEASLVKVLEEKGIGRPSTYAPTISTVINRGYVSQEEKEGVEREYGVMVLEKAKEIVKTTKTEKTGATTRRHLWPTEIGKIVSDFLVKFFPNIVDYDFTVKVEAEFDEFAEGKIKWNKTIQDFYAPFKEVVIAAEGIDRKEASQQRDLGTDPKTGKPVIARLGRYGPMVQIGATEDEEKPKFSSLRNGLTLEKITLEEALDLFKLPRTIGQYEGEDVKGNIGRFGPYVQVGKTFVSLKKHGEDPENITLERAIELYEEKKKADAEKIIKNWPEEEISLQRGPYGIYIKAGKKNVKIPKDKEPEKLELAEIKEIIAAAPEKKKRFARKKKK